MAYSLDTDSSILEPKKIKALDKMFSTFLRPIVKKWGTAQVKYLLKYSTITINVRSQSTVCSCFQMIVQEKNISEQLDAGMRYFDLRVAGKPESSDLFFYHGLYTTMTVKVITLIHFHVILFTLIAFNSLMGKL